MNISTQPDLFATEHQVQQLLNWKDCACAPCKIIKCNATIGRHEFCLTDESDKILLSIFYWPSSMIPDLKYEKRFESLDAARNYAEVWATKNLKK